MDIDIGLSDLDQALYSADYRALERMGQMLERSAKLETHFDQARRDVDGITTAAERAGKRAAKLDNFDFEEVEQDAAPIVRLAPDSNN